MEKIAWWATVHGVAKSRTWLKQLSKHSTSSLPDYPHLAFDWASQVVLVVKNPSANIGEKQVQSLGWKDPLEEGTSTHSSILARRIPWREEPGGLQSIGSQRVRHNWSDLVQHSTVIPTSQLTAYETKLPCQHCRIMNFKKPLLF